MSENFWIFYTVSWCRGYVREKKIADVVCGDDDWTRADFDFTRGMARSARRKFQENSPQPISERAVKKISARCRRCRRGPPAPREPNWLLFILCGQERGKEDDNWPRLAVAAPLNLSPAPCISVGAPVCACVCACVRACVCERDCLTASTSFLSIDSLFTLIFSSGRSTTRKKLQKKKKRWPAR